MLSEPSDWDAKTPSMPPSSFKKKTVNIDTTTRILDGATANLKRKETRS